MAHQQRVWLTFRTGNVHISSLASFRAVTSVYGAWWVPHMVSKTTICRAFEPGHSETCREGQRVRKTPNFSEVPAAFLLLSCSPSLADRLQASCVLQVYAHGSRVLLFPGQRSFLPEPNPTGNTIKVPTAYITLYYFSKRQNAPLFPLPDLHRLFASLSLCTGLRLVTQHSDVWPQTILPVIKTAVKPAELKPLLSDSPFPWYASSSLERQALHTVPSKRSFPEEFGAWLCKTVAPVCKVKGR